MKIILEIRENWDGSISTFLRTDNAETVLSTEKEVAHAKKIRAAIWDALGQPYKSLTYEKDYP